MYTLYTVCVDQIQQMGIREFRGDLAKRVEAAHFNNEPTIVTKNGEPRAALVSWAWFEAMSDNNASGEEDS